jgi:hypothetical protein
MGGVLPIELVFNSISLELLFVSGCNLDFCLGVLSSCVKADAGAAV